MDKIIFTKNLKKQFKKIIKRGFWKDMFTPKFETVSAVDGLDIEINTGEAVAFLGPNGAGKTTTIKMLSGLIYPSDGEINVLGFEPQNRNPKYLSQIGVVMGSKNGLEWDLTPKQNFQLQKAIYNINDQEFEDQLNYLNLLMDTEKVMNTQLRKLSLGERMKVELIGAILHKPRILFLDEPTVGLDIPSKHKLREFLREVRRKTKVTILLTSHDMDDIEDVCERVIVINKGQKVFDDSISALNALYSDRKYVRVTFVDRLPDTLISDLSDANPKLENKTDSSATVSVPKESLSILLGMLGNFELDDIDIIPMPLEKMIEDLFSRSTDRL